ncbi:hypothetical protein Pmani_016650 [Petrolisthes manimaculis]|uniref:Uncharacterized protein n=1 Tax=Petrolisthes manimaculis TaxID=1843537 RepID=A0AAE1PR46_9EUCA|nr:hypothetical protein Pmani_016650 [Petrolisthes manimaculis]
MQQEYVVWPFVVVIQVPILGLDFHQTPQRMPPPPKRLEAAKQKFNVMIQQGVARPSDSAWSSPLHMVPKQQEEEWKTCGDSKGVAAISNARSTPTRHYAAKLTYTPPGLTPPRTSSFTRMHTGHRYRSPAPDLIPLSPGRMRSLPFRYWYFPQPPCHHITAHHFYPPINYTTLTYHFHTQPSPLLPSPQPHPRAPATPTHTPYAAPTHTINLIPQLTQQTILCPAYGG